MNMEVTATPAAESRRSLRARGGSVASGGPGPGTPPGSESPRSDVSEGRASRSSRLSNPEFAARHNFEGYLECSAKTLDGLDDLFDTVVKLAMKDLEQKDLQKT